MAAPGLRWGSASRVQTPIIALRSPWFTIPPPPGSYTCNARRSVFDEPKPQFCSKRHEMYHVYVDRRAVYRLKPRPHQQQCRSNIRVDFVEKIVRLVVIDNVASTLLLVWMGFTYDTDTQLVVDCDRVVTVSRAYKVERYQSHSANVIQGSTKTQDKKAIFWSNV